MTASHLDRLWTLQSKVDKELRTEHDVAVSLEQQLEQLHASQEQTRRALLDLEKRSAAKATAYENERKAQRAKLEVRRAAQRTGKEADRKRLG